MRWLTVPLLVLISSCGESSGLPAVARINPTASAVESQYGCNADLPADHLRYVVVLVMTPAYGNADQIRAGNMGHVAIEVNGRLHDMGSLNGYAFTFAPSTAVRFWPWPTADRAVAAIAGHADCDGNLDELDRFDVTVTDQQADRIAEWWAQTESKMADPANRLYVWHGLQCASAVGQSLFAAGVIRYQPLTPADVRDGIRTDLRNTCGPAAGKPATMTIVQKAIVSKRDQTSALALLNVAKLMQSGGRSRLDLTDPDGVVGKVLWSDGDAYRKAIGSFNITPDAAVRGAAASDPAAFAAVGVQSVPNFAVNHWYHLDGDHVIGQAALGGWWVNGQTGRVIRSDDRRVIRFDLFNGDRIVTP
jgi:hypothetical protein